MENGKAPSRDQALQQMWYAPARRIRTKSAAANAVTLADRITSGTLGKGIDETALFVALHTCAYRAGRCSTGQGAGGAPPREWVVRWRRIREYIVQRNLGLVYSMMSRLRLDRTNNDDMHSDGLVALARAVERFDPWRGIRFSTYACNLIVRDLINASKRTTRYRRMFPYRYDVSFERPQPIPDARTGLYVERLQRALAKNLAGLTDLEWTIIRQRFPNDRPKRLTLQEIGDAIGVSKERVRQIQIKALGKLREVLDADPVLR